MSIGRVSLPHDGWKPRPHQLKAWAALRDPNTRTAVLAWHRRAGKDDISLHDTALRLTQRVGNYWHMLPEQEQARKAIWEAVNPRTGRVRWRDAFPDELIRHVDNQSMKLTFHNGATWQVLGSDNYQSLVGTTPVHIVMSEAALADPNAFAFFRPILLENNGTSLHISSTRGKNHFYDLYLAYKNRATAFAEVLSAYDTNVFTPQQLAEELLDYKRLWGDAVGEMLFKQEYLSEWNAASAGTIFGKSLALIKDTGRQIALPYDPRFPVNTSWDLGVGDDTVILFWQSVGGWERLIDWYADTDIGIDTYADVLLNKPYRYAHHVAPHDIKVREWGNKAQTRLQTAANYGIHFKQMPRLSKAESIAAGDMLLRRTMINFIEDESKLITDDCGAILSQLENYRFKFNKVTRQYTTTPEHNRASNYADALMTYAIFVSGATETYTGVKDEMESRTQAYEDQRLMPLLQRMNRPRRIRNGFG